ncbi:hypothetical protein C1T17_20780 (plasmid) [Sphingobium sp. SCG-1]|uniref:hypothetical protein n=1 Tax=Sphingobium sp. SCG-1 TaxID=2072936 RepID=UPI000CD6A830|nr:hypothetical protein [Sphingobium sp. SCG-1]AUW60475.1 hypothetical protein C1T17_19710 [Sphingobium sp. SCG-1]AUW60640.1 hypothetical protein C1T17_20780 [Sphingobium sp. SCG-1]
MSFKNKFLGEGDRSLYDNATRDEWRDRISTLDTLDAAAAELLDFRAKHIGAERETFDLEWDALWIEAELESRVATLRSGKYVGVALLETCACGTPASQVVSALRERIEAAGTDQFALEAIGAEMRRKFKPPIIPVNYWLEIESHLSERLMIARAKIVDIAAIDIEEWREKRGFTALVAGHGNAMDAVLR